MVLQSPVDILQTKAKSLRPKRSFCKVPKGSQSQRKPSEAHNTRPRLLQVVRSFRGINVGTLMVRIGFWGPLYNSYMIRNPQNSIGNDLSPYISDSRDLGCWT